jgi:hypothetical protein
VYSPDHTVVTAQISTRVEGAAAVTVAAVSSVEQRSSWHGRGSDHRFHGG